MHVPQLQQATTGSELYTVYLDGVAQTPQYATKCDADLVAANLKLANPDAVVTHSQGQVITTSLTYLADPAPEPAPTPAPPPAPVLFSDNFDSGARSATQNGIAYGPSHPNVTVVNGKLQFRHPPKPLGEDSAAEQRIELNRQMTDFWIGYDLTIPTNYFHRVDGASNNKFIAIYANPYSSPGFQMNFSTYPVSGTGESTLKMHSYNNGTENPPLTVPGIFISTADLGQTMRLVIHVDVSGIIQLWKNGTLFADFSGLSISGGAKHYIDALYLMGWSNSGFTDETLLLIDNLSISDTALV